MADDLKTLRRRLERDGVPPVALVHGDERLLVDEAVRMLLAAAIEDPTDALAIQRVDLAEPGTGSREVLDACRSMGLFAQRQAVLVRGAETLSKSQDDRDALTAYVKDPDPATTVILVGTQLDRRMGLVKAVGKHGLALHFETPKAREIPRWLVDEAQRLGHRLDHATARMVADLAGRNLQQLRLVMEQLSLYVGPDQPITREAVESNLAATRAHSVFELVDAVGQREAVSAVKHLHAMLGHREPALRIHAMLVRHFRQLWQVVEARGRGAMVDEVRADLGLHDFVARKLWQQATQFDGPTLRSAYDLLYRSNVELKSSGFEDDMVMERLVMDLCR